MRSVCALNPRFRSAAVTLRGDVSGWVCLSSASDQPKAETLITTARRKDGVFPRKPFFYTRRSTHRWAWHSRRLIRHSNTLQRGLTQHGCICIHAYTLTFKSILTANVSVFMPDSIARHTWRHTSFKLRSTSKRRLGSEWYLARPIKCQVRAKASLPIFRIRSFTCQ